MHRVHIGRTLLVGLLSWLVALLGSFITSVQNWPSPLPVLVPPAVALIIALGLAFVQAAIPTSRSEHDESRGRGGSGLSILAASLAIVLVLGIGGLIVSWAVRAVVHELGLIVETVPGLPDTFEKNAVERLTKQGTGRSGPLTLKVKSLKQGPRTVRAEVTVTNSGGDSVSLPLFGYCTLAAADGTTLNANASRSQWSNSVVGGGTLSGVIVFDGVFPPEKTTAALSFTTVFGTFDAHSLSAKGLGLRPLPA
jgi:MFS family permease